MKHRGWKIVGGCAALSVIVCTALFATRWGWWSSSELSNEVLSTDADPQEARSPEFYAHLLPRNSVGYVRITNIKGIINGFVDRRHLAAADEIRTRAFGLVLEKLQALTRPGSPLKISGSHLMKFVGDLKSIHLALVPAKDAKSRPEVLIIVDMLGRAGLELIQADLKPKLRPRQAGTRAMFVIDLPGQENSAFTYLTPTTVAFARDDVLEATMLRTPKSRGESLAGLPGFRQAAKDLAKTREVFAFLNVEALPHEKTGRRPFSMVSHVAGSLGLDGGLTLRAYAKQGRQFPKFLIRTPREKKFLSRIPAEAAFLISQGVNGAVGTRRNFVEWLLAELGQKEKGRTIVAEQWRKLAKAYSKDPRRIENEVFSIVEEIWVGIVPVKSESALFVAPDSAGRWGAAFLFDVEDQKQVETLTKKVFAAGERAKLPWKRIAYDGLTIHYVDFAEVAKSAGKPVPPDVAKHAQLRVGYAAGKDIFYAGTVEAIKLAYKPTGKTLAEVIDFTNVDQQNAIMISLLPGRVLHRTFGVPKIDDVLTRLASQIPKNSNYTVTLNFEPAELTFRTNIPFISLGAWAAVEWMEERP